VLKLKKNNFGAKGLIFVEYDPLLIFVQLSAQKHMCYFRTSESASSMYNTFQSLLLSAQ